MRQTTSAASVRMMRPIAPGHDTTDHAQLARRRFVARTCPSLGILWLALLANTACGAHKRGNCELTCDPSDSNQCPDGLVCGNQKYCVADQTVVCESSVGGSTSKASGAGTSSGSIGGGTPSTTLGVGGTSSQVTGGTSGSLTTTGGAATGGATTDGGGALLGGSGGTASTVATAAGSGSANLTGGMGGTTLSTVSIAINPTSPWCVGVAYNATVTASGGGPSYTWTAANLPSGVTLGVGTGASNTLTGTPLTAGVYEPAVTVTDTLHQGQLSLTVNDRPSITTTTLADACLGEVFSTKLEVSDSSQLEWSLEPLPELGLTLDPDGTLHGEVQRVGTFDLRLSVRNKTTGCSSLAKTLQLKVYGEDAPSCPTIRVKGQTLPATPAPAACVGWPYSAQFEVLRGSSPPSWSIVEQAPGYLFDSTTQTLTNNDPKQDASVTLQISDGVRKVQRKFSIPLREKCWLGYVDVTAPESGAPYRLNLVDPLLGARLVSPITDPSESVEDFKFSPDGRFVAYRAKDVNGQYTLWLWQGPKWNAIQKLNFEGSVIRYEWSSNSLVLAVAIKKTEATLLGGVNVARVPVDVQTPADGSKAQIQDLVVLTAVAAAVDSEMAWYGNDVDGWRVAFHSKKNPDQPQRALYYAALGKDGFAAPQFANRSNYDDTLLLIPNPGGFFALRQSNASLTYFPIKTVGSVFHGNLAISPNANLLARADSGSLNIFRPEDTSSGASPIPWKSTAGCDAVLTWARDVDRVACIDTKQATVSIYSLDGNGEIIPSLVEGSRSYTQAAWAPFSRLFSPSGRLLALTTSNYLYLGASTADSMKILWSTELSASYQAIQLSFSPDERLLALLGDDRLNIFEPEGLGDVGAAVDTVLTPASACQEEQLALPSWCGSGRKSLPISWSPNSDLLATVTQQKVLRVHDLRIKPMVYTSGDMKITPACEVPCQREFKFQP